MDRLRIRSGTVWLVAGLTFAYIAGCTGPSTDGSRAQRIETDSLATGSTISSSSPPSIEPVSPESGARVQISTEDLIRDSDQWQGRRASVSATVRSVLSPDSFTIHQGEGVAGSEMLVMLVRGEQTIVPDDRTWRAGDRIRLTGQVVRFDDPRVSSASGLVPPARSGVLENRPVLLADSLILVSPPQAVDSTNPISETIGGR